MDDLLAEFLAETLENVAEVGGGAVARAPGADASAGAVFRLASSICATAKYLDIPRLNAVAAAAETLAGAVRGGQVAATPELQALMLAAVGRIAEIARVMQKSGREPAGGDHELVRQLENAAEEGALSTQINALDKVSRPNMGAELSAESPPRLRLIIGGKQEGARDETLPDRR